MQDAEPSNRRVRDGDRIRVEVEVDRALVERLRAAGVDVADLPVDTWLLGAVERAERWAALPNAAERADFSDEARDFYQAHKTSVDQSNRDVVLHGLWHDGDKDW